MKKVIFLSVFNFFFSLIVLGQDLSSSIKSLGRVKDDKILLRWAPTDPIAWYYGNRYGYRIERYTITRDSSLLRPIVKDILTPNALKPVHKNFWESEMGTNDYAAIAAQAIFGETFELSSNYPTEVVQIINKTKELNQRFSFALFAADQSFKVARMSGLGFIDSTTVENEKYLYKIQSNIPDSIHSVKQSAIYISLGDRAPLPKPINVTALFGDKVVTLKWGRTLFEKIYNSFIIERSDDAGKTFNNISNEPVINTTNNSSDALYYYAVDSIPENFKNYQYRIKGIDSFGEIGPPSEIVEGQGVPNVEIQIAITGYEIDYQNQEVELRWQIQSEGEEYINGFEVQRSKSASGPFNVISERLLSYLNRAFTDQKPLQTAYYRVACLTSIKEMTYSHPYLIQLEDSIPPATPNHVSATIDSSGVVELKWKANQEKDFKGYRVYRSNFRKSEFAQVTSSPIKNSIYVDSIGLKNLSRKIFYKIVAVDSRNNKSESSTLIEVVKPDVVAPVSPIFKKIEALEKGILLNWIPSSSVDLDKYFLYRFDFNSKNWQMVTELEKSDTTFLDTTINQQMRYSYTIIAIDKVGIESKPATSVSIKSSHSYKRGEFTKLNFTVNRSNREILLSWKFQSDVKPLNFLIYRSIAEEPLSLYKQINGNRQEFVDKQIFQKSYRYRLIATFMNGTKSKFSEEILIE